jgi:hypothetical protein
LIEAASAKERWNVGVTKVGIGIRACEEITSTVKVLEEREPRERRGSDSS